VRPRAAPEPEPEPELEPEREPEPGAEEAPAAPAAEAAAFWPDEFEEREGAEEGEEPEPPAAPRAPRRRRKLPRAVTRTLLVLVLGGAVAGAYWWFQPEVPLPKWSTITGVGSAIGGKVSALGSKAGAMFASLRHRATAPAPTRQAAKPPSAAAPPVASRPAPPSGTSSTAPPPVPARAATPAPPPPPVRSRIDLAGDSLTRVVRDFADRARLFDRRQLPCAGLARGLELVESRWIAYNAARRSAGVLEGARAGRDQALYAGVDSVERKFEQSGCARP